MALFDTHCHLDADYGGKAPSLIVAEAKHVGVTHLITIATEVKNFAVVRDISEKNQNVWHTIGIHPHEAITMNPEDDAVIETASRHPKCVAIGEIGLDYHYDHSPKEVQMNVLERQLKIAAARSLPVVVHSREAESDLLKSLTAYAAHCTPDRINKGVGIIHCFSGSPEFGRACVSLGFYLSFSGILTFKKADEIRLMAKECPQDRILIETDSPYLAPIPHRGKICEPQMVRLTAQKLAEIRGKSLEAITETTTQNARRVFGVAD